jgi:hypothetical protein
MNCKACPKAEKHKSSSATQHVFLFVLSKTVPNNDSYLKPDYPFTIAYFTLALPFHGSLSCLQMYTTALTPQQIQYKSNCPDAGTYLSSPCPTGYQSYDGTCIQVWNFVLKG